MNKITVLSLFIILAVASGFANPRTKEEAKAIAERLAAKIGTVVNSDAVASAKAPVRKDNVEETEAYYVFDYGNNEGFIIVSGDDRMPDIVGYTDSGVFSEENMPEQLKAFLEAYTHTVAAVAEGDENAVANVQAGSLPATVTPVAPLLGTIAWNQDDPYNLMCPAITVKNVDTRCVTGCAATAVAQIMRYHKFPDNQVAINGYTTTTHKITLPAIAASSATEDQYDWENMLPIYTSTATETQKNAVAKLMYHVGVALKMDYGLQSEGGSSASYSALKTAFATFGYDTSLLQEVYRQNYSYQEWRNIIMRELNARRPISYNGQSSGGGHSFVCDGIDNTGLVHINWGWGGSCNGYFDVAILNPNDNSGIGASATTDGYNIDDMMVIGITPHNTNNEQQIDNGNVSNDWSNIDVTITADKTELFYNTGYTLYNPVKVTVKNNGDSEFYGEACICYKDVTGSYTPLLYVSAALAAGASNTYTIDLTVPKISNAYPSTLEIAALVVIGNNYDIKATKTFSVSSAADPVLTVTNITSNATAETHNGYPVVKEKTITYNVTIENTGGYYRSNIVYFGFLNPSDNLFHALIQTVEIPNGTTTLTFTDDNPSYGYLTGISVWSKNLSIGGDNKTGYLCYAEGPTQSVPVTDANKASDDGKYYATMYLDYAVTIPSGVEAYTATIQSNSSIKLNKIEGSVIPAYTGVVLKMASAQAYDFTAATTSTTLSSDLQGVLVNTPASSISSTVYVLSIKDGKPMFQKFTGTTLAANKGYIIFTSSAKSCTISNFDDEADAISPVAVSTPADNKYYNLMGMPVEHPTKGLYIINGKKIILK